VTDVSSFDITRPALFTCDLEFEVVVGRRLVEADVETSSRREGLLQHSHNVDGRPLDGVDHPLRLAPDQRVGERMKSIHAELALKCDVISGMLKQPCRRRQ